MTKQRKAILEALRGTRTHPTAAQLFDMVRPGLPGLTLATVYRNLRVLQELGLVREVRWGAASSFDAITADHTHIRCVACGRVDDLDVEGPDWLTDRARENSEYEVEGYDLVFEGTCPDCINQTVPEEHEGSEK